MFGLDRLSMGLVTLVITVAVGLMVLSGMLGMPIVYDNVAVTGEQHTGSNVGTLPANVTVDNVKEGIKTGSETITWEDTSGTSNTTLEKGTDYEVISYEDGKFEIQSSTTLTDYNSTEDNFYFDYTYLNSTETSNSIITGNTALGGIMDWVGIIVLVVVASVILTILRSRGAFGGTTMRQ